MYFCSTRPRFGQKKKLGTEEGPMVRMLSGVTCSLFHLLYFASHALGIRGFACTIPGEWVRVSFVLRKTVLFDWHIDNLSDNQLHKEEYFCSDCRNVIHQQWCFLTFLSRKVANLAKLHFTPVNWDWDLFVFNRPPPVWSPSLTSAAMGWAWAVPQQKARNQSTPVNCWPRWGREITCCLATTQAMGCLGTRMTVYLSKYGISLRHNAQRLDKQPRKRFWMNLVPNFHRVTRSCFAPCWGRFALFQEILYREKAFGC